MSIFRAYDIRGVYPSEINEVITEKIGIAFGNYLKNIKEVVVGCDFRKSSPSMKRAVIFGLLDAGKDVVDVGNVPAPVLYFGLVHYGRKGGVFITASHNPAEYNGMKLKIENAIGLTEENGLPEIEKAVNENKIKLSNKKGKLTKQNIEDDYINYLTNKIKLKRKLKVVIDAGNGACGPIAVKIFKNLGCNVIPLYIEPDGLFPNHIADPHNHETLKDLQKKVLEEKADFGVAYDGDGDRAGYVDNKGKILSADDFVTIFCRQALAVKKGNIAFEVRVSKITLDDVKKHGGTYSITRVGHSFVMEEAFSTNAVLGAEQTGHMFFPYCYYSYDDAIFASLKMAEFVSKINNLADYVDNLPKGFSTPEIRIDYPEDKKFEIIDEFKKEIKKLGWKFIGIDGARIDFPNGWALVRASNTQPQLTLRFEGDTKKDLEEIKLKVGKILSKYGIKIK